MNTTKKILSGIVVVIALLITNSCVHDDDYALPPVVCNNTWVANTSISDLYTTISANGGANMTFDGDDEQIFEGYVISSDSTGNIYKTLSIQDNRENPTKGITVLLNRTNFFNNFPLGSQVRVKLNDLSLGYYNGLLQVAQITNGALTFIDDMTIDDHVTMTCDDSRSITPVVYPNIAAALADGAINTLITIENVQFASSQLGQTYADAVNSQTMNRTLEDANGNTVVLRNSGYATFAGELLPEGSGSITAILSIFDSNGDHMPSDFQLFIRDTRDVHFDNPRFGNNGGGNNGGGEASYMACVNEDFESYDAGDTEFGNYFNVAAEGSYFWKVTNFGGNNYIQMSSHNSSTPTNVAYFVVPVNFSNADKFSFKTNDGYDNGSVLKVYYSTNYTIGSDIADANLTDITSSFTISSGHTSGYGPGFVDSGEYNLSSLNGNGAIVFKYEGTQSVTTTMQIDDIRIIDNDDPDCGNGGGTPGGNEPTPPSAGAALAFAGGDFENWATFQGGLNSFGLKPYATQGTGTGQNGSASFHILTDPTTTDGNDYVFTSLAYDGLPSTYSKIDFFMKGTADKSVSLNVYKADGSYYSFNLGSISSSQIISVAENNQYAGTVNTGGQWIQVSLDLSAISDLNTTDTSGSFFALKIGKNANYDLQFDNFTIE